MQQNILRQQYYILKANVLFQTMFFSNKMRSPQATTTSQYVYNRYKKFFGALKIKKRFRAKKS